MFIVRFSLGLFIIIMYLLIQAKYNASCQEKDEIREQNLKMNAEISDFKETMNRCIASNKIEVNCYTLAMDGRKMRHIN